MRYRQGQTALPTRPSPFPAARDELRPAVPTQLSGARSRTSAEVNTWKEQREWCTSEEARLHRSKALLDERWQQTLFELERNRLQLDDQIAAEKLRTDGAERQLLTTQSN